MKLSLFLVLSVVLTVIQAHAVENVELCLMEDAIHAAEREPDRLTDRVREFLRDKQIVFVNGYGGCLTREFRDSRSVIRTFDQSVPMSMICPPNDNAIEDNVDYIVQRLGVIGARNPDRQVILFGHSKGGAEVLETMAAHPEFFAKDKTRGWRVANAVTVSAAFGGSIIADLLLGHDPKLVEKWERFAADNGIIDNSFTRWVTSWFVDYYTPGFLSLSRPLSTIRNRRMLASVTEETRELLKQKVFFVTSHRDADQNDMPFFLKSAAQFLHQTGLSNDGLVLESDQRLPELGTHLLRVSRAGHFSLIDALYGESECRREFTRLLLLKLATAQSIPQTAPAAGITSGPLKTADNEN